MAGCVRDWLTGGKQKVLANGQVSKWQLAIPNEVPQGFVLRPILFIMNINDKEIGLVSSLSVSADDTKVGRKAFTMLGCEIIQKDPERNIQ